MENHYMFHPASLHPPSVPDSSSRRRSDWVLLDNVAYIADRPNATTVRGHTPGGQPVEVTFYLADPPALSHLCVHCPGLDKAGLDGEPAILCCGKDVAILQVRFSSASPGPGVRSARRRNNASLFVFNADREHPSLHALPDPYPLFFKPNEVALFPTSADDDGDDGGEGFHVAVLRPPQLDKGDYELHTFSSKTWAWTMRAARLPPSKATGARIPLHAVDKAIALEGDLVAFVDLWKGIIFCRILEESPCPLLHHVRLPPPMHINRGMLNYAPAIRDVACIDGAIRFVEIACRTRRVLRKRRRSDDGYNNDPRHNARVLYDSDLEDLEAKRSSSSSVVDDTPEVVYVADGWSVVTWNRLIGSDHWAKDCEVDVNDVTVDDPRFLSLLPELRGSHSGESAAALMNKSLVTSAPTFGVRDADVVYLMCKVEITDETAWVLTINTRKKSLQDLASFSTGRACEFYRIYRPCAISI